MWLAPGYWALVTICIVKIITVNRVRIRMKWARVLCLNPSPINLNLTCKLPVNALLAEDFLAISAEFWIGSNNLVPLTLGVDRDLCQ